MNVQVDDMTLKRQLEAKIAAIVRDRSNGISTGNSQWVLNRYREKIMILNRRIAEKANQPKSC